MIVRYGPLSTSFRVDTAFILKIQFFTLYCTLCYISNTIIMAPVTLKKIVITKIGNDISIHEAKRYFKINQHLLGILCITLSVFQVPFPFYAVKYYPFFKFNDLHQLGKKVGILAKCETHIPLFLF